MKSELWKELNETVLSDASIEENYEHFKSSPINARLSTPDPTLRGENYLKCLIYNLAQNLSSEDWLKLDQVKNRDVGKPYSAIVNDREIDLDYLQSLYEMKFIESQMDLDEKSLLEIGAGYGRTAHMILSNYDCFYTIVDLRQSLMLANWYLADVLTSKQFRRLKFISPDSLKYDYDLAIQIDGFEEMEPEIVQEYLAFIGTHCDYFYTKNPVGSYREGRQGAPINGWNEGSILENVERFLEKYRPEGWEPLKSGWAKPWPCFWEAIYG